MALRPFNPFSAACFAPGVLPWFGDEDVERILERALVPGARLQILGPKGSGKTTLLCELERRARVRVRVSVARVRGSRLEMPEQAELVLVDEWEEVPWLARLCLRRARSLVVTAHRDVGFETACVRAVDAETAEQVVRQLLGGGKGPDRAELGRALERHAGNLREVLFELYDRYQRRNAGGEVPSVDARG